MTYILSTLLLVLIILLVKTFITPSDDFEKLQKCFSKYGFIYSTDNSAVSIKLENLAQQWAYGEVATPIDLNLPEEDLSPDLDPDLPVETQIVDDSPISVFISKLTKITNHVDENNRFEAFTHGGLIYIHSSAVENYFSSIMDDIEKQLNLLGMLSTDNFCNYQLNIEKEDGSMRSIKAKYYTVKSNLLKNLHEIETRKKGILLKIKSIEVQK